MGELERKQGGMSLVHDTSGSDTPGTQGKRTLTEQLQALASSAGSTSAASGPQAARHQAGVEFAGDHDAPARRVAENDDGQALNAIIKVVGYGPGGKVVGRWGARAHWEGRLPIQFHGARGHTWTWSNPAARETRLQANADGTGGMSIEAWAQRIGAVSVDVFAQNADAVTLRKDARKDNHAPGHATEERDTRDGSTGDTGSGSHAPAKRDAKLDPHAPGHAFDDRRSLKKNAHDGADKGTPGHDTPSSAVDAHDGADTGTPGTPTAAVGDRARAPEGTGNNHEWTGSAGGGPSSAEVAGDDAESEEHANSFEQALGINHAEEGDEEDSEGSGYQGGSADGRTGKDASTTGTGPGGPEAKDEGKEEASNTAHDNDGTKFGDRDGVPLGSENGRYDGDGHEGDDGVRGAGGLFGGVIAVPEALKGAVELALLIEAGDVTGEAGALFSKGIGKGLSIAAARKIVAREARIAAAKELRVLAKELARNKAFTSLAKVERDQVLRITYWETQRRYFRAYLKAAKTEQRAVRRALKTAKPSQVAALEARRASAEAGEALAKAEPVAGRLPQNHAYAGGEFPRSELPPKYRKNGLKFTDTGHPDFAPYAKTLPNGKNAVRINLTGSRSVDEAMANRAAGLPRKPSGWTWHHEMGDAGTMMLVPEDLHQVVRHTGGTAEYKHRTGVEYVQ